MEYRHVEMEMRGSRVDDMNVPAPMIGQGAYDADAAAFFTAAGITDVTQKRAVNQLVLDLKSYSLWSKFIAIYPMVGGSAASHKYNLKDPRDLDAAFRLTFTGGWTHSSTGALPNGSTGYADTYIVPASNQTSFDTTQSFYSRTNTNKFGFDMGVSKGSSARYRFSIRESEVGGNYLSDAYADNGTDRIDTANTDSRGLFCDVRPDSSHHIAYKNGSQLASSAPGSGVTLSSLTGSIYLGASHLLLVGTEYFCDRECAFAGVGSGTSATDNSNLYTAVQAYQTTLGRQV